MSSGARWTAFFILTPVILFLLGVSFRQHDTAALVAAGFLATIVLACFPGPFQNTAVRIIAIEIFSLCLFSSITVILDDLRGAGFTTADFLGVSIVLVLFAAPSAYVAITGRLPDSVLRRARRSTEPDDDAIGTVRIISVPPGEAPLDVREKWIGLELPLLDLAPVQRQSHGVTTGEIKETYGYLVDAWLAVQILHAEHPDAAEWWHEYAPHMVQPGKRFIFAAECCQVLRPDDELWPPPPA